MNEVRWNLPDHEILSIEDAVARLQAIEGTDLRPLAEHYGITVFKEGKLNKGWVGNVLERSIGLPVNNKCEPDGGTWELKAIPVHILKSGKLGFKETMAITMVNPLSVAETDFEASHLYEKIKKTIICVRLFRSRSETSTPLLYTTAFDIYNNPDIFDQCKEDYEAIQRVILEEGFDKLSGRIGVYIQARPKGPGHGSNSRAFYAKCKLLEKLIDLRTLTTNLSPSEDD